MSSEKLTIKEFMKQEGLVLRPMTWGELKALAAKYHVEDDDLVYVQENVGDSWTGGYLNRLPYGEAAEKALAKTTGVLQFLKLTRYGNRGAYLEVSFGYYDDLG